eukprot:scaffold260748_cov31-Tisochrysis_lutea.AAC.3
MERPQAGTIPNDCGAHFRAQPLWVSARAVVRMEACEQCDLPNSSCCWRGKAHSDEAMHTPLLLT